MIINKSVLLRALPNACTLAALMAGMVGFTTLLAEGATHAVFYWIVLAAGLDVLDGALARALGVSSQGGKYLDALSDAVCFGALPALWLHVFLRDLYPCFPQWLSYLPLLLAPCAVFRLMRFVSPAPQSQAPLAPIHPLRAQLDFKGLPVPFAALFITSLGHKQNLLDFYLSVHVILVVALGVAWMMLSPYPLAGLKFSHLRWKGNQVRYGLLFLAAICLFGMKEAFFIMFLPLYLLYSFLVVLCSPSVRPSR